MTYRELFYKATRLINKGEITLGEYDEMTKPLEREIEQTTWIPVSERLPEENKQVLIQYRTRYRDDVNLFDVTRRVDYNYWQGIGREIDVIAWMPLPEPYEGE